MTGVSILASLSTVLASTLPTAHAAFLPGTFPLGTSSRVFLVAPITAATSAGTLLASVTSPYSYTTTIGTTSGTIASAVFRNPTGTLDFYYQFGAAPSSAAAIDRVRITGFDHFATQIGFRIDASSVPGGGFVNGSDLPDSIERDATGAVVSFRSASSTTEILPGTTTAIVAISTDATNFTAGNVSVIDGGSQTVRSFQPAAVPEPGALFLTGTGLLAFVWYINRSNESGYRARLLPCERALSHRAGSQPGGPADALARGLCAAYN